MLWPFSTRSHRIECKLDEVLKTLRTLTKHEFQTDRIMMADLSRITATVAANGTVMGSAVALIEQIAEALRNVGSDQGAIDALATELEAQAANMAAAVTANTPVA